jgi:hypothetical protein
VVAIAEIEYCFESCISQAIRTLARVSNGFGPPTSAANAGSLQPRDDLLDYELAFTGPS